MYMHHFALLLLKNTFLGKRIEIKRAPIEKHMKNIIYFNLRASIHIVRMDFSENLKKGWDGEKATRRGGGSNVL